MVSAVTGGTLFKCYAHLLCCTCDLPAKAAMHAQPYPLYTNYFMDLYVILGLIHKKIAKSRRLESFCYTVYPPNQTTFIRCNSYNVTVMVASYTSLYFQCEIKIGEGEIMILAISNLNYNMV